MLKQESSKHLESSSSEDEDYVSLSSISNQLQLSVSALTKTSNDSDLSDTDESITLEDFLKKEIECQSDSEQEETEQPGPASATHTQSYHISTSVAVAGVEFELIAEQPVSENGLTTTTSRPLPNQNHSAKPTSSLLITTLTSYFKNPPISTSVAQTQVRGLISSLWNVAPPTPDVIKSKLTHTTSFFKSLF